MKWLNNIKIGTKLTGVFALIILLCVVVGIVGYINMKSLDSRLVTMNDDRVVPTQQLGEIREDVYYIRGDVYKYILIPDERESLDTEIQTLADKVDKTFKDYSALDMSPDQESAVSQFAADWTAYLKELNDARAMAKDGDIEGATKSLASGGAASLARQKIEATLNKLTDLGVQSAEALNNDGRAGFNAATIATAAVCLLAVILGLVTAIVLTRGITGPLNKAVTMMKELGMGRLKTRLKLRRKDEVGTLTATMDQFADDLQNIVIGTMKKISDGDLSTNVVPKDDQDEIAPALKGTIESLRNLTAEMNKMYQEQKAGDYEYFMPTDGFKGVYKEVADGYNATVNIPISAILTILGILNSYAEGDFNPVLQRLVGKQVVANDMMDLLRNNLRLLIAETEMLTNGAAQGKAGRQRRYDEV